MEFLRERNDNAILFPRPADNATVRIAAVMAVCGPGENLTLELLEHDGWLGARATNDQNSVEGWVQLRPGVSGPVDYNSPVTTGNALLCGTAADGERFTV